MTHKILNLRREKEKIWMRHFGVYSTLSLSFFEAARVRGYKAEEEEVGA